LIDGVLQLDLPRGDASLAPVDAAPSYIIGPENHLLLPAIEALLAGDSARDNGRLFNPLVLVGGAGSGKSHLAQGLVRRLRGTLPEDAVRYFTAADFGREVQAAYADGQLASWRSAVRSLRLLVIEDLDRLRPQPTIQSELRHALDAIVEAGRAVIVTAQCEPAAIGGLDAGLRDRLSAGLTVRIQRPGLAARKALLQAAAERRGTPLADEQLDRLARREVGSTAELLGRLARFDAHGETPNEAPASGARDHALLKQIIAVTSRYFAVTQAALVGPSRRSSLVAARNAAVHLARRLTPLSYADIGRALGGRDHTTIMHAERRLAESLPHDPAAQQALDELDRLLRC
jgi:chromosomal replication initiator protein